MKRGAAAVAAIAVLGVVPATASAHKYSAYAGNPGKTPGNVSPATQLNRFFPATLKIRAGDKVTYANQFLHTVSVLAKGQKRPSLVAPDGTNKYDTILDANNQPFFFSGLQKFIYEPTVFTPQNSTAKGSTVGDGKMHSSGFFAGGAKPGLYTLKFAKPGTYTVHCLLHPGMQEKVKVLKRKARGADTNGKVAREVAKQAKQGFADAAKAQKTVPPPNTVLAGVEKNNATAIAFFPNSLTVAAGTTVDFKLDAPSEVHNMVFGPESYVDDFTKTTDLLPIFGQTANQVSPPLIYGSEPPGAGGAIDYTGANHGNGFLWTQLMGPAAPLPSEEKIKFSTPGTFTYFCAIHGRDMSGTIIVQ